MKAPRGCNSVSTKIYIMITSNIQGSPDLCLNIQAIMLCTLRTLYHSKGYLCYFQNLLLLRSTFANNYGIHLTITTGKGAGEIESFATFSWLMT